MTRDSDSAVGYAVELLSHYGFELRGYSAEELVHQWLKHYTSNWIRLAVIEALYQGRYKAVSVEQILTVWFRRGQPIYRFNHEFERLICRKLPKNLTGGTDTAKPNQQLSLLSAIESLPDAVDENLRVEVCEPEEPVPIDDSEELFSATSTIEEVSEMLIDEEKLRSDVVNDTDVSSLYEADWSRSDANKNPIHQFTPLPDYSGFYFKLKKVADQEDTTSTNVLTPGEQE
ncbi:MULTISPECIES: hypothetical protein [unclassified Coleofasciculus]|uniref:hypothetical protein n=1 Tax=unclassified Coleofasciculus TaxID=2692782 RepID=UPI0018810860|nr:MULTISPECIES: hypothetical protein [unclassified Coleofasciculus]MBE9128445.1 hypothetical protein [Coleofasciculus sp. LEGE 07081]MBE9149398.1 hypothetical protein [Coleofasciculus sp. LEGE 07092]